MSIYLRIPVPEPLQAYARGAVKATKIGCRGDFDGTQDQQYYGLMGELLMARLFTGEWHDYESKNDHGVDIVGLGDCKIDVKTCKRHRYIAARDVHCYPALQQDTHTDVVLFLNYHAVDDVIEICGWIPKRVVVDRDPAPVGKEIATANGSFKTATETYIVPHHELDPVAVNIVMGDYQWRER